MNTLHILRRSSSVSGASRHFHRNMGVGGTRRGFEYYFNQYYHTHSSVVQQKQNNNHQEKNPFSNRSLFKEIPVHPSILSHIQSIGVGIRSTKKKKKLKNNKSRGTADNHLLSETDEMEYFQGQRISKHRRPSTRTKKEENTNDEKSTGTSSSWMPPPPFSVQGMTGNKYDPEMTENKRHIIKRLPVKVLGSVASTSEEMPRGSKGLAEVAIAGRSNVGKSTLLNALLYGNQFQHGTENRKYIRGKTPEGAKIGKGVKATVSNRPGETRAITFYQLSSRVDKNSRNGIVQEESASTSTAKMSLALADLPGYGFAYASEQKAAEWQDLMKSFIIHRGKSLKRILLLLDARHGFKHTDSEFLHLLQEGLKERTTTAPTTTTSTRRFELPPIQIVLTKCDLVSQVDLARRIVQVRQQLSDTLKREPSALPVMLVSAKAGLGFNNMRGYRARGGILELQRELAALVPTPWL